MVSWGGVKKWSPDMIGHVGDVLVKVRSKVRNLQDEIQDAATPAEWSGNAADAAKVLQARRRQELEDFVARIAALRVGVDRTEASARQLLRSVEEADALAGAHGYLITDDGDVVRPPTVEAEPPPDVIETRRKVHERLAAIVEQVLRTAEDVDEDLLAVMKKIMDGDITDDGATTLAAAALAGAAEGEGLTLPPLPPSSGMTVAQSAAWWKSLSEAEREWLAKHMPNLIGNRDGVSAHYRDLANRHLLQEEKRDLAAERDRLQGKLDTSNYPTVSNKIWLENRIKKLDAMLEGIGSIETTLASTVDMPESRRHYLLSIDGDNAGQAIIAKGNPDTATHTATYVPGTFAGLEGIEDDLVRGDRMHDQSTRAGAKDTSVITWVGYDAPQGIVTEATSQVFADKAKGDLAGFQEGLRATYDGPARSQNTVVAHSYGNVVLSQAARTEGLDADKMIMVASPGGGDEVRHVSDLSMKSEDVYAVTDKDDFIRLSPYAVHGIQPGEERFEATTFESDSHTGNPVASHSKYWDPNNPSLEAMGLIIAGKKPEE